MSVSYKCGWGSDKTNPHPNLPPTGEGTRVVVQLAHYQRQIIASTSQIGEVAVVRMSVSYKCGRGSDKTNPHPNLPPTGEGTRVVAQLVHSPRPLRKREEFQVELERNLEIRVRGSNNRKLLPHPLKFMSLRG